MVKQKVIFIVVCILITIGLNVFYKMNSVPKVQKDLVTLGQPLEILDEPIQFSIPKPPYFIDLKGSFKKIQNGEYEVNIDPFYFRTDTSDHKNDRAYPFDSNDQFKIVLKKQGKVIREQPLLVSRCAKWDSDVCIENDYTEGNMRGTIHSFSEIPDEISFYHLDKEIYSLKDPQSPLPVLSLNRQEYGDGWIRLEWTKPTTPIHYAAYVSNNNFAFYAENENFRSITCFDQPVINPDICQFKANSFTHIAKKKYIDGDLQVVIYATDGFRTQVVYGSKSFKGK